MASAAGLRNILREVNEPVPRDSSTVLPGTVLPPTPTSPEEEIIKQRGRRKIVQYQLDHFFDTPLSSHKSPSKFSPRKSPMKRILSPAKFQVTPTRSSPRKKLNLNIEDSDTDEVNIISEMSISSHKAKKPKLQVSQAKSQFEKALRALSHDQLVQLVCAAVNTSEEVKEAIEDLVPTPDIGPLADKLESLHRNIFKSFPRSFFGRQDDSFCYNRVKTHIDAFKKQCIEDCRRLSECQHWPTAFQYIFTSLEFAKNLPDWALASHNKSKQTCIRQLSVHLLNAIKKGHPDKDFLQEIYDKTKKLEMNIELKMCLEAIEKIRVKLNKQR